MENVIDFLATKEVLIVLAIIGLILFVYFILWFHEFMKKHEEKKKLQNNTMQLNKLVEEVARANKEENVQKTPPITKDTIISTASLILSELIYISPLNISKFHIITRKSHFIQYFIYFNTMQIIFKIINSLF